MLNSIIIATITTRYRHGSGHPDRACADALPVPRSRPAQPADLHPDGHARGDPGRLAAGTVGQWRAFSEVHDHHRIAHVMFCISFVVVTIRARIAGFNRSLEEAAMDLGADELHDLPQGDPAADLSRASWPRRCSPLRCRSTTIVVTSFIAGQTIDIPALGLWRIALRRAARGQRPGHAHLRLRLYDDRSADTAGGAGGGLRIRRSPRRARHDDSD